MGSTELETRLTSKAQAAFESGCMFVYSRDGVLWLAIRAEDGYRTLRAIGIPKMGIRRLLAEVTSVAATY
jgi:hypothetical protein